MAHDVQEHCSTGTLELTKIDGFEPISYFYKPLVQSSEQKRYEINDDTAFTLENGRLLNLLV